MTAQYTLKAGNLTATTLAAAVGKSYNIGLSDGSHYYGYNLQNWGTQTKQRRLYGASVQDGFVENSDITTRGALTNFGSPNLVDRDLVYFPRVSQGDFSGGGLQVVLIDPSKFFDSDLEVRFPGYLQLRQQYTNGGSLAGLAGPTSSIATYNGNFWATPGTTVGGANVLYEFTDPAAPVTINPGIVAKFLCTDGVAVYYSDGASIRKWDTAETVVANTVNGTAQNLWVIQNGTGQYFAYYIGTLAPLTLYKVDLSSTAAFPIAAAGHPLLPTGGMQFAVIDLVPYNNGVAILTADSVGAGASAGTASVWFHDGAAMTKIVDMVGYAAGGMANCLGDLYITAAQTNVPGAGAVLAKVAGGSFSVVAEINPSLSLAATSPSLGRPVASDSRVYFMVEHSQVSGVSGTSYVGIYDSQSGAYSHGIATTPTVVGSSGGRSVAVLGNSIGTIKTLNSGSHTFFLGGQVLTSVKYQTSGWMVSSNLDFATPAIEKRFRTIDVHHSPLNAGEAILVNGYVDLDPTAFTTLLTPTATATNSTVGTTTTTLSFGANVGVGHMLYYALKLTAGTSNLTSPKVNYVTVEVGGTWVWDFDLDCSVKRRDLTQSHDDFQGVGGKDLYYLIRNAYENGTLLTLYLAEGVTYTVTIETVGGNNVAYMDKPTDGSTINADDEWLCHVVLRQVA